MGGWGGEGRSSCCSETFRSPKDRVCPLLRPRPLQTGPADPVRPLASGKNRVFSGQGQALPELGPWAGCSHRGTVWPVTLLRSHPPGLEKSPGGTSHPAVTQSPWTRPLGPRKDLLYQSLSINIFPCLSPLVRLSVSGSCLSLGAALFSAPVPSFCPRPPWA